MKSPLLPYFQVKSKLSCYLIAIVGGYLVVAGGSSAQASTQSSESKADATDRDNSSPNQLADRSAIDRLSVASINNFAAKISQPDEIEVIDRLSVAKINNLAAKTSQPNEIEVIDLLSVVNINNLAAKTSQPDEIEVIDRLSVASINNLAAKTSQPDEIESKEKNKDTKQNKENKEVSSTVTPAVGKIAQTAPPFTIPPSLAIPSFTSSPSTFQSQSTINPINSVLTPELILKPNNTPAVPSLNAPPAPNPSESTLDSRFILSPQSLDPKEVDPFSTQFILNGDRISHLTETVSKTGYESGNFRTSDLNFNIYKLIKADNIQSVTKDSVVRVNSKSESVGVRSIAQKQDIAVSISKPQTLIGVRQQISLDANCLDGSGKTCTYLPGIKIDDSTIDQRKLQPTGVKITSQFGEVISPTDLAAIRQPGFQGGADTVNGPSYGIDQYIPAVGTVTTPWSENPVLTGSRREDLNSAVAVNYTRMNQDFATNGAESTLGRTIRSANYINNDRNQLLNAAVQVLGQVLPEAKPSIAPGKPGEKIVVNPNLYRAANAVRIPENSQTVYQTGMGYAASRGQDPNVPPSAQHQSVWIGLSPIVDRKLERDYSYITRRAPEIVSQGGGEGGSVPVSVNLNDFGFNSAGLQNAYGQGYNTIYNRDVDRIDVETLRQRTDYFPHISFTGTNLNENSVWRYYTGAIANLNVGAESPKTTQDIKAYVGTDYSMVNPKGMSFNLGGIGYVNPDPEHSTQVFGNATQAIALGANPRNNLTVGVNANYIVDGATIVQSIPVRSTQSSISAGLNVNLGDVSLGGTQFIGNILPESTESKTIFNVGLKINDRLNLGAFYTAVDRNISSNPYGANLSLALDPSSNSLLSLGWNAAAIDFRRTLGSTSNVYRDNTFSLSLRYGF
jgi:hypothetical protein